MDTFIIIHGYGSSPETSSTIKTLRDIISEVHPDAHIITPSYDERDPTETAIYLLSLTENVKGNITIIGSSLGGFWANWLASNTHGSKLILINPSLTPSKNLQKYIGDNTIHYYECMQYVKYEGRKHTDMTLVILAKDDDVVPYQYANNLLSGSSNMIISDTGGHRMSNLIDFKNNIMEFINTYIQ